MLNLFTFCVDVWSTNSIENAFDFISSNRTAAINVEGKKCLKIYLIFDYTIGIYS